MGGCGWVREGRVFVCVFVGGWEVCMCMCMCVCVFVGG